MRVDYLEEAIAAKGLARANTLRWGSLVYLGHTEKARVPERSVASGRAVEMRTETHPGLGSGTQ